MLCLRIQPRIFCELLTLIFISFFVHFAGILCAMYRCRGFEVSNEARVNFSLQIGICIISRRPDKVGYRHFHCVSGQNERCPVFVKFFTFRKWASAEANFIDVPINTETQYFLDLSTQISSQTDGSVRLFDLATWQPYLNIIVSLLIFIVQSILLVCVT